MRGVESFFKNKDPDVIEVCRVDDVLVAQLRIATLQDTDDIRTRDAVALTPALNRHLEAGSN